MTVIMLNVSLTLLMTWRVHLTNQAIQHLHILAGQPTVLAVWIKQTRVHFYDMDSGRLIDARMLPLAPNKSRSSDEWQEFTAKLTGPDYAYFLPLVRLTGTDIHVTDDGKLHLYHLSDDRLFMDIDDEE